MCMCVWATYVYTYISSSMSAFTCIPEVWTGMRFLATPEEENCGSYLLAPDTLNKQADALRKFDHRPTQNAGQPIRSSCPYQAYDHEMKNMTRHPSPLRHLKAKHMQTWQPLLAIATKVDERQSQADREESMPVKWHIGRRTRV